MAGNFSPYTLPFQVSPLPTVQNSKKITRDSTIRIWQSRSHVKMVAECWNRRPLKQSSQACRALAECENHNEIMSKSDRTCLVIENDICFCTCTLVLMYYKYEYYFQDSPHRIHKIVGLKMKISISEKHFTDIFQR